MITRKAIEGQINEIPYSIIAESGMGIGESLLVYVHDKIVNLPFTAEVHNSIMLRYIRVARQIEAQPLVVAAIEQRRSRYKRSTDILTIVKFANVLELLKGDLKGKPKMGVRKCELTYGSCESLNQAERLASSKAVEVGRPKLSTYTTHESDVDRCLETYPEREKPLDNLTSGDKGLTNDDEL